MQEKNAPGDEPEKNGRKIPSSTGTEKKKHRTRSRKTARLEGAAHIREQD